MKAAIWALAGVPAAILLAVPAHADVDTDFAGRLHGYGIYGARDYNAWIGKLTCKRLINGIDHDAFQSAAFVGKNLKGADSQQTWQFLGAALSTYCPDKLIVVEQAGGLR
ncbi:hypothetical protein AWC02_04670 [Mycolicibacter engbaekii]|uniref:DUF732 domain-containing protein n=1 Tax=Mycolicibacter engbaekii TaxID=188915 RepID=A0A1X1U0F3_9MYCO|nr:DUF732 domain-containing protein [Mycolicibacter engbaekii]ORV50297.1 hypothetical protein AWC02_04670 [Mycolicibacter engbaekii]